MSPDTSQKLSLFQRTEILMKIINNQELETFFNSLTALQMKDLRNFLEDELMYMSTIHKEPIMGKSIIRSKYMPVSDYYHQQNCGERLESCLDETCYPNNAVCFSMKMASHINRLLDLLKPYLEKSIGQ